MFFFTVFKVTDEMFGKKLHANVQWIQCSFADTLLLYSSYAAVIISVGHVNMRERYFTELNRYIDGTKPNTNHNPNA